MAQSPAAAADDDLAAARTLFFDALRDEQAGRFADAVEKFQRVRAVRDTASVEYRIGTCYDALGRRAAAYGAFQAALARSQGGARNADIAEASRERLQALSLHVALLTLQVPDHATQDLEVRVDDTVIARDALREPIVLAPGSHVISTAVHGGAPTRSELVLSEGAHVAFSLPTVAEPPIAPQSETQGRTPPPAAPARPPAQADRLPGWIAIASGAALLTGAGALLWVRNDQIAMLDHDCPGGICPPGSDRSSLESTRSRALVEGPAALALGGVGVVGVALGIWLAASGTSGTVSPSVGLQLVPVVTPGSGAILVQGGFE